MRKTLLDGLQHVDYAWLLPFLARLPLCAGYRLSAVRGYLNGRTGRDWRSVALSTRHIARMTAAAYRILCPEMSEQAIQTMVRQRFQAESREEFEGRLIVAGRASYVSRTIGPNTFTQSCLRQERGLVLLTPHFDSFMLGIAFLGLAGMKINVMTSSVTSSPLVSRAVQQHFFKKYRGMERMMNGGRMLDREPDLRPFYKMLERGECLVVLADAPAVAGGAVVTPCFLGARRTMAGGAFRIAQKTGSDIGAFVCRYLKPGCYQVEGGPITAASDPQAIDKAYAFLSRAIMAAPERWWAADLFPAMVAVAPPLNDA